MDLSLILSVLCASSLRLACVTVGQTQLLWLIADVVIYRVSIKSFPDYKHYKLYVTPQLEEFQPWIIFQQDGAPPYWVSHVRRFLDAKFPNRWIGTDGPTPWPPRSPDIIPLTSFYGGMLWTKCFRHQFQILQI